MITMTWAFIAFFSGVVVGYMINVMADFGVPGEAGTDQNHLDRPRYVRIAENGSLLVSDDHRIVWVENGTVTWELAGSFCDIELTTTGWAALNGTSSADCTSILHSNGTMAPLPHRANRIHRTAIGFVVGGMHQNITEVDLAGTTVRSCEFVTGYISDIHLDHFLYDGDLYSYNLSSCSSTAVETPAADSVYSFHPMPNGTFAYGLGWDNGSRAVRWGNWTGWTTSFPEDLDWNGTSLAAVDLNHHVIRVWDLVEEPQPDDQDGDGVPDLEDDCPTVWGNATDAPGCPDVDGDGVADHNDPCPTDPGDGCLDSDGDGWNDTTDDCPGTWGNSSIDRVGCPDRDGDGVSNDNDPCPDDPLDECGDRDGDGYRDGEDDCPDDWGNSTVDRRGCPDRDGDGRSDDGDAFPDDPGEWSDQDGDGVGDNTDVCPSEWGNSTSPPGCPDRDGDGLADIVDPCPDDPYDLCDDPPPPPDEVVFYNIQEDPGIHHYLIRFVVNSNMCVSEVSGYHGDPIGEWLYFWTFNYTGLESNTTYDFTIACQNNTEEGWLNVTGTTLVNTSGDGVDGDGDGPDGDGGEGNDGTGPGLLDLEPGGIPITYLAMAVVLLFGLSLAIFVGARPEREIYPPRMANAKETPFWVDAEFELDELEEPLHEVDEPTIPLASPDLFQDVDAALPMLPKAEKPFLPEAPSPMPVAIPAIHVAEAEQIPGIIQSLRAHVRMEICEENRQVLDDVMAIDKRLRQLRDDGDIARRKYEKLLQEVDELYRAVQNLTPAMERREWDV